VSRGNCSSQKTERNYLFFDLQKKELLNRNKNERNRMHWERQPVTVVEGQLASGVGFQLYFCDCVPFKDLA
jgi:hypothetical protein